MGTYHKNALPSGYELAEYAIETVLGHGGFGITYLARDTTLGALVAIKEFLPGEIAQRDSNMRVLPNPDRQAVRDYQAGLKNFVKEARALAHFKHPHIVRVLRFLEANGTAYVVMEYEEGQSLADYLKLHGQRLDEPTILRVFIPILNGLHAVHEVKMLHLDIKPENIYLRKDGSPMLIDFGSARRAMTETKQAQRIALTHGYAPIEQYPDKGKPGPWTDIYALGASMYRCISGKRPDDALSRYQAVLKYQTDPLLPATKVGRDRYQAMLLECVDWAIQIYAKDRPQSARELQDGLMGKRRQATAAAAPMRLNPLTPAKPAIPPSTSVRTMRRDRLRWRLRAIVGAGRMLLVMTAIGAAVVATSFYWNEIKAWLAPTREPEVIRVPAEPVSAPEPEHVSPSAEKSAAVIAASKPAHPAVVAPRTVVAQPPTVLDRTFGGHKDWVQSVIFSPDSKRLASASTDRTVKVWDVANGTLLGTLRGHEGAISAVAFSPDGKWIASASDDGSVRLWDGYTGVQRAVLRGSTGSMFTVAFSPDGMALAAAGRDRTIFIWDVASGNQLAALEGHTGDVFALLFSADGKTLVSAGADKTIRSWNRKTGQELATLTGHKDAVLALALSPDGRWLASGDAGQSLRIWEARSLAHARTLTNVGHSLLTLAFSPDSRWLAVGTADETVVLLESNDRAPTHTLSGHQDFVQSVAFSPDGRWLASGSRDRSVRLWRTK